MDNRLGPRSRASPDKPADIVKYDNPLIGLKSYGPKGRGVVAIRDIPVGALIERCPVLIIPSPDRAGTDRTIVFTYVYMWEHGAPEQALYEGKGRAAIALGLSSLLNHSYEPNADFIRHIDALELELRSNRAIRAARK